MQTLDIERPGMPDLQFTLLVTALCTSRLASLNIPDPVRTMVFDRCWVLLHDSPPPRRPQERVLDLRPWTQVTLDALVETIRVVLTEAGIRTVTWEQHPSTATQPSTPAAMPLIERFGQLYPQPFVPGGPDRDDAIPETQQSWVSPASDLQRLVKEMAAIMEAFSTALDHGAGDLAIGGAETAVVERIRNGAEVMRRSASLYVRWARHYAALVEGRLDTDDDTDALSEGV